MKGTGCTYRPEVGETCRISGPNCDDEHGYIFNTFKVLWKNDAFILYGKEGCCPNVNRWDHIFITPISPTILEVEHAAMLHALEQALPLVKGNCPSLKEAFEIINTALHKEKRN